MSLQGPFKQAFDALRNVFYNVGPDDEPYPMLDGHGARILDDPTDLVALQQLQDEDRLIKLIRDWFTFILVVSSR